MPAPAPEIAGNKQRLVLTGVTVIDTRTGAKTPHRSVVIENGKISAVVPAGDAAATGYTVEASGKFVVPGYLDMHAHPLGSRDDEGVVLDADPLAGVANFAKLHGVVRAGTYYSADMLDALKKKIEQRHAAAA